MLVVGDLGPFGHVLVGDDQRLAIADAVGEASAVHDRANVSAAQLAVAAVVDVLVGGGVADGEDELLADAIEHLRGDGGGHRVGIVAFAERLLLCRGRGGGRDWRLFRARFRRWARRGEDQRCQQDDHALASSQGS